MNGKWFVICGNNVQYLQFVKEKITEGWPGNTSLSMSNFIYVDHPDKLRGWTNPHGWFYGTWRNRKDIRDILINLSVAYRDEGDDSPNGKMHQNLIDIMHEVLR